MESQELEQLCALLNRFRHDNRVLEGLSIIEQEHIAGAAETICSLVRRHLDRSAGPTAEDESLSPSRRPHVVDDQKEKDGKDK